MGEVHKLLTEHGKQVLLRSEVDRRVLDAAAAYMAAEEGEIGFVYAGWAQASLPTHGQTVRTFLDRDIIDRQLRSLAD